MQFYTFFFPFPFLFYMNKGELKGHRERVSGFAFCRYPGQEEICASSSDDGSVKIWDSQKQATLKEHKAHQVQCEPRGPGLLIT